jgi:hypothetical protein
MSAAPDKAPRKTATDANRLTLNSVNSMLPLRNFHLVLARLDFRNIESGKINFSF